MAILHPGDSGGWRPSGIAGQSAKILLVCQIRDRGSLCDEGEEVEHVCNNYYKPHMFKKVTVLALCVCLCVCLSVTTLAVASYISMIKL